MTIGFLRLARGMTVFARLGISEQHPFHHELHDHHDTQEQMARLFCRISHTTAAITFYEASTELYP